MNKLPQWGLATICVLVMVLCWQFMVLITRSTRQTKSVEAQTSAPIKITCHEVGTYRFEAKTIGHVGSTNILYYTDMEGREHWLSGGFCHVEFSKPK